MITDETEAKKIIETMNGVYEQLNDSIIRVQENCVAEEFMAYRRAVGAIMAEILDQVLNPLFSKHPSLKPPEVE